MLTKIYEKENPVFTIITPLRLEDNISEETKESILYGTINSFNWYSYSSDNNVAKNYELGFNEIDKLGKLGTYVIKVDNDTVWNNGTLDELVNSLQNSEFYEAYAYCGFEYFEKIFAKFPKIPFDPIKLRKGNYISSNSMFKSSIIRKIPLVTDDQYFRLLDYAYFLKLLKLGYHGKSSDGYFKARASANSVSAGSPQDYKLKMSRVHRDFL